MICEEEELLFQEAVLPEIPEKPEKRTTAVCLIANKRFACNICLCVIVDVSLGSIENTEMHIPNTHHILASFLLIMLVSKWTHNALL